MWILSSLARPKRLAQMIASYAWSGENVLLALYSGDECLVEYTRMHLPDGWRIETVDVLRNGPTYDEILRRYPDEGCYGFLADDVLLDVPGMLRELEREAGDWNVAYANDQHHEDRICTMPCLGGNLVRAVGYLAPKTILHSAIDCAWHEIGRCLGRLRYRADLTYTHLHPLFGTGPWDETYKAAQQASVFFEDLFRAWVHGGALQQALARVREAEAVKT